MSSRGEALPSEPAPLSANAPLSASSPPCGEHPRSSDLSEGQAPGGGILPVVGEVAVADGEEGVEFVGGGGGGVALGAEDVEAADGGDGEGRGECCGVDGVEFAREEAGEE